MNCATHVETPAVAYCRTCGKPICSNCTRDVRGVIYCEECLASQMSGTMPPPPGPGVAIPPGAPPVSHGSPGLAAVLGFIPGVGAMYNGEYTKGFIHVLIFVSLIWAADHVSGLFGLGIAAFVLYMPIEAYQTAKAKMMGMQPPDPFGFNNMNLFGGGSQPAVSAAVPVAGAPGVSAEAAAQELQEFRETPRVPVGALILIGLGVIFLLNQFGWFHFDWFGRFWPLILIAVGIRVLMKRSGRGW
jgi:LiaI-LiaF-like transmembrane region/B-box zinc finger